eukprot:TRINITY_DN47275_c0_g1_i1.p1 TRINITY_DN47275_c0_g1~~TRINITY_DN47275_c0_g1_i1.p1  ORF type:complete len:1163 (-),score=184.09 TRINITY_DN47275_c0_g1_i1:181-3669(-)
MGSQRSSSSHHSSTSQRDSGRPPHRTEIVDWTASGEVDSQVSPQGADEDLLQVAQNVHNRRAARPWHTNGGADRHHLPWLQEAAGRTVDSLLQDAFRSDETPPDKSTLHSPAAGAEQSTVRQSSGSGARDATDAVAELRVDSELPTEAELVESLWDRNAFRNRQFDLKPSADEHPCFAGFNSMINQTDRCKSFVRQYPPVGSRVVFFNLGLSVFRNSTLGAVVGDLINVWWEDDLDDLHKRISVKAAELITNRWNIEELKPSSSSNSWLEHECKMMGSMPFVYTCSNRINILVQRCNGEHAWVMTGDFLQNFPNPAHKDSVTNHDQVFYMCKELIARKPNPYSIAITYSHELAHVIQGGFGFSFQVMTEGSATFLEGNVLNLPPRPMTYANGFSDWNKINAAHIYGNTQEANSGKFYQITGLFLTYLAQDGLLGMPGTISLQNYRTFETRHIPWGRGAYNYFLQYLGQAVPKEFETYEIDPESINHGFADALLDFRVALAASCILDDKRAPTEAKYRLPAERMAHPYWDCTSFKTWRACKGDEDYCSSEVREAATDVHYGGAAIYRIAFAENLTVSVSEDADWRIRTKVLAAGNSSGGPAEVKELRPGEFVNFGPSAREAYVVQVNVDPAGEMIAREEMPNIWHRSAYRCNEPCKGKAWTTFPGKGLEIPQNTMSSLRSKLFQLPRNATDIAMSFNAMWDLPGLAADGSTVGDGCPTKGHGGVQVRAYVYNSRSAQEHEHDDGDYVVVLRPKQGYGSGPAGQTALHAFGLFGVYSGAPCDAYEGWGGQDKDFHWKTEMFELTSLAGKWISVEVLFANEYANSQAEGFWIDNIQIKADKAVIFSDDAESDTKSMMFEHNFALAPTAGEVGRVDGVPVVVQYPEHYQPDKSLVKLRDTRFAPWSATWNAEPKDLELGRKMSYMGWAYTAPGDYSQTARLHPWQEACVTNKAPFQGKLRSSQLFTLVDKVGTSAATLTVRSPEKPFEVIGGPVSSPSPGVEDPGNHRFDLRSSDFPTFKEGELFLLCVGTEGRPELASDGTELEPFIHLPMAKVFEGQVEGQPGYTFLLATKNTTGVKVGETKRTWADWTYVVRSEFYETGEEDKMTLVNNELEKKADVEVRKAASRLGHADQGAPVFPNTWVVLGLEAGALILGGMMVATCLFM